GVHQAERIVDLFERHLMGNQIVDVDFAVHIPIDDLGHIRAAACTAEGRALPDAPRHELERPRADLLTRSGDADDDRYAPAAMATFQGLAHQVDVADAFEAVIGPAIGQRHQMRDQIAADLLGIDEMRQAEFLGQRLAGGIQINADDFVRADEARALNHIQSDAAQTEHHDIGAGLHLGGIDYRADARGYAATDIANLVEWSILANFRNRDFRQDGKIRERGAAHIMVHQIVADRKTTRPIGHESLALGRPD